MAGGAKHDWMNLYCSTWAPSSNSTFCLLLKESSPAGERKRMLPHGESCCFTWVNVGHVLSQIKMFLNQ